jgi:hypothetical protein
MAIEKAELSGSLNVDEMLPVTSTPAGQSRGANDAAQNQPRRREATSEKDSPEPPAEDDDKDKNKDKNKDAEETDRPPHRVDSLA